MNLQTLAASKLVVDLGWTLLHSLWQIAFVSILLFLAIRLLQNRSANLRYAISLAALAVSLIIPIVTFIQISAKDSSSASTEVGKGAFYEVRKESLIGSNSVPVEASKGVVATNGRQTESIFSGVWEKSKLYVSDFLPVAVFFWLFGIMFFSIRLCGGFFQQRFYRTAAEGTIDSHWQDACSRLCDAVGIGQTVKILKSTRLKTPIAVGVFKPVILIPAGLFLQIDPRELETIIVHELIHIRRYDPLVNIGQCFIETILFYHPAVWWISAQVRREREFATDAAVVEMYSNSHVVYARALANLEEIRLTANIKTPRHATAANGGNLMQRIQRILKVKTEASTASSVWTTGLAFLLTSVFLLATFSFNSSSLVNAQVKKGDRKLVIGFVSIPPVDRTANAPKDADATARLLIEKLEVHKVPAIGFLQGGMVSDGDKLFPVRANIARMWRDAGFEVGLGGFRHINLYNTSAEEYIANIEKNERVAKKLIGDQGLPPRYFSYPFLNTGKTSEDKAKVEAWLASRGYTSIKYTLDNNEWMYSFAYDMARNDNDLNTMKEIREAYLSYMNQMFEHAEAYSAEMFGRDVPQTMVLTPSRLITDTADEFFAMAAKRGYSFISVDEAQSDEAYKTKENFAGEAGISWFDRWALTKGSQVRSEPGIDQNVQKIWTENQAKSKK